MHQKFYEKKEIHLWYLPICTNQNLNKLMNNTISLEEKTRASKFINEMDGKKFLLFRFCLRSLLGYYTNTAPEKIKIAFSNNKKPFITSPLKLTFNISHSNNALLIALSSSRQIGVDIEFIRPLDNLNDLFSLCFHQKIPNALQLDKFYQLWTYKEALLKALGIGLSHNLNQIEIKGQNNSSYFINNKHWKIQKLINFEGYKSALAYESYALNSSPAVEEKPFHLKIFPTLDFKPTSKHFVLKE